MALWLLQRRQWFANDTETVKQMIVRAGNVTQARKFAAKEAGAEGPEVWLMSELSTIGGLSHTGEKGVLAKVFRS